MKKRASCDAAQRRLHGLFLSFEGGEGTGKSTQIALLRKALERKGHSVLVTREPGGSRIADRIRQLILDPSMRGLQSLPELLLYEASRAQHLHDTVRPALESGKLVLCDRFADSSIVYQGAARGVKASLVRELNRIATGGLFPARTFLLDIDPRLGLARAGQRGRLDRLESESLAFHRAVRAGYLRLARSERRRIRLLDASRTPEELHRELLGLVEELLP